MAPSIMSEEHPLPSGWAKFMSRKFKRAYFYHADSDTTTWDHPAIHPPILKSVPQEEPNNNKTVLAKKRKLSEDDSKKTTKCDNSSAGSSSNLNEEGLKKLDEFDQGERECHRKKTEMIRDWAADVTKNLSESTEEAETPVSLTKVKYTEPLKNKRGLKPMPLSKLKTTSTRQKDKPLRKEIQSTKRTIDQDKSKKLNERPQRLPSKKVAGKTDVKKQKTLTPAMKAVLAKQKETKKDVDESKKPRYVSYNKPLKKAVISSDDNVKKNYKIPRKRNDSETSKASSVQSNIPTAFPKRAKKLKTKITPPSVPQVIPESVNPNENLPINPVGTDLRELLKSKSSNSSSPCPMEFQQGSSSSEKPIQQQLVINEQTSSLPTQIKEDIDMEIDGEGMSRDIMREIRGMREELIVTKPPVIDSTEVTQLPTYSDPLYIVVDTNITLAHLKFLSELKDYPIPAVGPPILVIPWMVLQELDSLKDAVNRHHTEVSEDGKEETVHKLNQLARQAIKFIGTCLQGDHPRLKGESAIEAGTPIQGFNEESNDDSIIHCALNLKYKADHSHIVMLSNDKNLCNKALVLGIKAFSQKDLMFGLRSLFQNGTVAVRNENYEEYYEEYKLQELISKRRHQADELSIELQCVLREGLSKIIEEEMKKAYDENMWLSIVKIQPPWTLHDVFTLFEKHWIAVFGFLVKRNVQDLLKELKDLLWTNEGQAKVLDVVKKMIDLSLGIFNGFAIVSNYEDVVTKCVTACNVLDRKCQEYLSTMTNNALPVPADTTTNPPSLQSTSCDQQKVSVEESSQSRMYQNVLETFDTIWKTVTHYSALIFYSLNFPSPLIKELDASQAKPTKQEALTCLSTMTPCLLKLIKAIQNVMLIPVESLPSAEGAIQNVVQCVCEFSKEVMKTDCFMKSEELLLFCTDQQTRSALVQGLSQLDRSYALLQQCIDFHESFQ